MLRLRWRTAAGEGQEEQEELHAAHSAYHRQYDAHAADFHEKVQRG